MSKESEVIKKILNDTDTWWAAIYNKIRSELQNAREHVQEVCKENQKLTDEVTRLRSDLLIIKGSNDILRQREKENAPIPFPCEGQIKDLAHIYDLKRENDNLKNKITQLKELINN